MKFYKVVHRGPSGRLFSYNVGGRPEWDIQWNPDVVLEYKPGEITRPIIPNSKIFVFGDLNNARATASENAFCEVWEVEVTRPSKAKEFWHGIGPWGVKNFWRFRRNKKKPDLGGRAEGQFHYPNTWMAATVKLVARVN